MNPKWTDFELEKSVIAYFKMIKYEKEQTVYIKAEINRALQKEIPARNHKSIEYRWQNISAVLNDHKLPFIDGYKPARHVGSSVKEKIWKIITDLRLVE